MFSALLEHLKKVNYHFDTGILATPLLLKVLTENGRADLAYKLMNQRDFPSYGYLADKKIIHFGKHGMGMETMRDADIVIRCSGVLWHGFIIHWRV